MEIVYNIISFIVAIITTVAFTVYAKRTLDELKNAEVHVDDEAASASDHVTFEMEKPTAEEPKHVSFSL